MDKIAIYNKKGGCGKTTTAVNLAAGLVRKGKKVLVIDTDSQGHATLYLKGFKFKPEYTLFHIMVDKLPIEKAIISTYIKNLDLIPADEYIEHIAINLGTGNHDFDLKKIFSGYNGDYDYIIIDANPAIDVIAYNILICSDYLIIPVNTELFAVDSTKKLIEGNIVKVEKKYEKYKVKINILGTLLTFYDKRNRKSKAWYNNVKAYTKANTFDTFIRTNVALSGSTGVTKSIFDYNKSSYGAIDYGKLTDEVLERLKK